MQIGIVADTHGVVDRVRCFISPLRKEWVIMSMLSLGLLCRISWQRTRMPESILLSMLEMLDIMEAKKVATPFVQLWGHSELCCNALRLQDLEVSARNLNQVA
jgi:hypothetical protein